MGRSKLLVLDVVGLTRSLLEHAPRLRALAQRGWCAPMDGVLPAVTCTAQATMLGGVLPRVHGIVANGWYFRDLAEVWLWRQSNHLVQGPRWLDELRDAGRTTAKMFWWYNMHSSATWSVTPRPEYPADGRKIPSVYSHPQELGQTLQKKFGTFPLFHFWGPTADIQSTRWIADASVDVVRRQDPDVTMVYLPHLDYDLQRFGPSDARIPQAVAAVDAEVGKLLDVADETGRTVVVVSEYGIEDVHAAVTPNRVLREAGYVAIQETSHGELLDAGASRAFAMADHQVAHIYVRDAKDVEPVRRLLERTDGVERVLDEEGKRACGLDHPRSGELVALSERDHFFAYHYWFDDARAPDFAATVDIHRKPGYDPTELLFDPDKPFLKPRLAGMLLRKKAGFRVLMRAISLKPDLARGSHGLLPRGEDDAPLFLCSQRHDVADRVAMTGVKDRLNALLELAD